MIELPDLFKKKKKEEESFVPAQTQLPEELEQFRTQRQPSTLARNEPAPFTGERMIPPQENRYPDLERIEPTPVTYMPEAPRPIQPVNQENKEETSGMSSSQKLDMILQKLETIDTRIKLLEERSK